MGHKKVCFECRKSFNLINDFNIEQSMICPDCGNPATFLNHKFKPPKKQDKKGWELAGFLKEHGFYFQSTYAHIAPGLYLHVPYPSSIEEAKEFVVKYKNKKTIS